MFMQFENVLMPNFTTFPSFDYSLIKVYLYDDILFWKKLPSFIKPMCNLDTKASQIIKTKRIEEITEKRDPREATMFHVYI